MPVMDGFTATRIIRDELQLTLPILAMTAGVTEFEQQQCIASGMNDLIAKPIEVEQMLATINRYLPGGMGLVNYVPGATPALAQIGEVVIPLPTEGSKPTLAQKDITLPVTEQKHLSKDIFNVEPLYTVMAGDTANIEKIIRLIRNFVETTEQKIEEVREAKLQGQYQHMASLLHSLRGSVGMLGAKHFVEASRDLELILASSDFEEIDILFKKVEQELAATMAMAKAWLADHPSSF